MVECEIYEEYLEYYPYSDWWGAGCTNCCWFWNGFWNLFKVISNLSSVFQKVDNYGRISKDVSSIKGDVVKVECIRVNEW